MLDLLGLCTKQP